MRVEDPRALKVVPFKVDGSATCVIEANTQKAYCWGNNGQGQLGLGHKVNQLTPIQILGDTSSPSTSLQFQSIYPGSNITLGLLHY